MLRIPPWPALSQRTRILRAWTRLKEANEEQNRHVDGNGQTKFWPIFLPVGQVFGQMGHWLELIGIFGLKCFPSIADWFLKVANVSRQNQKFPDGKTEANLGPRNWRKSAISVMKNLQNLVLEGCFFSAFYQNWNFRGGGRKNHQDPINCCQVIC